MVNAGVDMFHASTRRFWEPEFPDDDSRLNLAGWAKKITGLPSMTVGRSASNDDFLNAFRRKGAGASRGASGRAAAKCWSAAISTWLRWAAR